MKLFGKAAGTGVINGVFLAVLTGFCALFTGCEEAPVLEETPVNFIRAVASGNEDTTTTVLYLFFDKRLQTKDNALKDSEITLTGIQGLEKGMLTGPHGDDNDLEFRYDLGISRFTSGGELTVAVAKAGFAISGSPKTVRIFYNTPIDFKSASANGNPQGTSTELYLKFSAAIIDFNEDDINLSGNPGIKKETLYGFVQGDGEVMYTLGISGSFTTGTVNVAVSKANYTFSPRQQQAAVYFWDTPIQFISVSADGNSTTDSTLLTLSFSQQIAGLSVVDINLSGIAGIQKDALSGPSAGGPPYLYTLPITLSDVTVTGPLTVSIDKTGFTITPSSRSVTVYHTIPITLIDVSPDIAFDGITTTKLILTFNMPFEDKLTVNDIFLSGDVPNVNKGALSDTNPYSLEISGFTKSGTVEVRVSKAGYSIKDPIKQVDVTYATPDHDTVAKFITWLSSMGANTHDAPYTVRLQKLNDGTSQFTVQQILMSNRNKYLDIILANGVGTLNFGGCTNLVGITIEGSTAIGADAFKDCTYLSTVNIGTGTSSIAVSAFSGCSKLTKIIVNDTNNYYSSSEDGVLYNKVDNTKTTLLVYPAGKTDSSFTIPNTITTVGASAFSGCVGLRSVTIPIGVTSIGNTAFYGCSNLNGVTFPYSVSSVGDEAFRNCTSLSTITIPSNIVVQKGTFSGCTGLTSVSIWGSRIDDQAFMGCIRLTDVTIPNNLSNIGIEAFSGCTDLTTLTFTSTSANPPVITTIGNKAFKGCTNLGTGTGNSLTIPTSVSTIGEEAFAGCNNLTTVTFTPISENNGGFTVLTIGASAFSGCSKITGIAIPERVYDLGKDVFAGCSGITTINTGGLTDITAETFKGCSGLRFITIPDSSIKEIDAGAFSGFPLLETITVSVETDTTGSFSKYSNITGAANAGVLFEETTLFAYPPAKSGAYIVPSSDTTFSVTVIGDYAFRNCTGLTSITLPTQATFTKIGDWAFYGCSNLINSITIPVSVTSIGKNAFGGCRNTVFSLGSGSTQFSVDAVGVLYQSTRLIAYPGGKTGTYNIPNTVTDIEEFAFYGSVISGVTFPLSSAPNSTVCAVTSIGKGAFGECANLTTVQFAGTFLSTSGFSDNNEYPAFPGDLRLKFYFSNTSIGTAGTYTRAGDVWTKQ